MNGVRVEEERHHFFSLYLNAIMELDRLVIEEEEVLSRFGHLSHLLRRSGDETCNVGRLHMIRTDVENLLPSYRMRFINNATMLPDNGINSNSYNARLTRLNATLKLEYESMKWCALDYYKEEVIDFFITDKRMDCDCQMGVCIFLHGITAQYAKRDTNELKEHWKMMQTKISDEVNTNVEVSLVLIKNEAVIIQ